MRTIILLCAALACTETNNTITITSSTAIKQTSAETKLLKQLAAEKEDHWKQIKLVKESWYYHQLRPLKLIWSQYNGLDQWILFHVSPDELKFIAQYSRFSDHDYDQDFKQFISTLKKKPLRTQGLK